MAFTESWRIGAIRSANQTEAEIQFRRTVLIEHMIRDFERLSAELDREISFEENRTGIHDPAHFAYPTYAKAARLRRDNLRQSAAELRAEHQRQAGSPASRAIQGILMGRLPPDT